MDTDTVATGQNYTALSNKHTSRSFRPFFLYFMFFVIGVGVGLALSQISTQPKKDENVVEKVKQISKKIPPIKKSQIPTATPKMKIENGWKTYNNSAYNISFAYPPDWELHESHLFENKDVISVRKLGNSQREGTEYFDAGLVAIMIPLENVSFEEFINRFTQPSDIVRPTPTILDVTINNIKYKKMELCGVGCFMFHFAEKNNKIYGFTIFADGPEKEEYKKTASKIVKSITF